jgi:hypothetical protein
MDFYESIFIVYHYWIVKFLKNSLWVSRCLRRESVQDGFISDSNEFM